METTTRTRGSLIRPADAVDLHSFASVGYDVVVYYSPNRDEYYVDNTAVGSSQARAIAIAANRILAAVSAEIDEDEGRLVALDSSTTPVLHDDHVRYLQHQYALSREDAESEARRRYDEYPSTFAQYDRVPGAIR